MFGFEIIRKKKNKKKGRFMKNIIISVFLFLFIFVGVILYIFLKTGSEPSTLIGCVFGILGLEFGVLSKIKTTKKRSEDNEDKLETEINK